jgi:vitamin B12 transporter
MKLETQGILLAIAITTATTHVAGAQEAQTVEKVVVTGTRIGKVAEDRLGTAVTVIDERQLDQRQTRYVGDILRDVPGMAVNRSGGAGGTTQVRMRGAEGNHTLVLFDGADISDPFQGEFDFSGLLAGDIDHIEILRGSQSALYGSDAIGGVINVIPKRGRGDFAVNTMGEAGSFSSYLASANAGFGTDVFDVFASTTWHTTQGTNISRFGDEQDGAREHSWFLNTGIKPAANVEVRAIIRQVDTRADGDPQDFDFLSPTQGFVIDGDERTHTKSTFGNVQAETSGWNGAFEARLVYSFIDATRYNYSGGFPAFFSEGHRDKVSAISAVNFDTGEIHHRLTGAIDWKHETYQNLPIGAPTPINDKRVVDNTGFVGEYTLNVGQFDGGIAVRGDQNDNFRNATTYRVQASYRLGDTRLRATAGSGIKNPTNFELFGFDPSTFIGNPSLKPEQSVGWDVGVDQYLLDRKVKLTATWFSADLEEEIFTDFLPGFISTPKNRDTTSKRQGLELTMDASIDAWTVNAAYTWLDATEDGLQEVRRAPHVGSLNVTWAPTDKASLGIGIRYNGRQVDNEFIFATPGDFVSLKPFTLVNAYGTLQVTDKLQAFARVENLLDENYEEVFSFASPGRAAYIGLKMNF